MSASGRDSSDPTSWLAVTTASWGITGGEETNSCELEMYDERPRNRAGSSNEEDVSSWRMIVSPLIPTFLFFFHLTGKDKHAINKESGDLPKRKRTTIEVSERLLPL